jgi:hypothetical protein
MEMDMLKLIRSLQEKRRKDKITPDHVPEVEIMNAVLESARSEMNDLYKSDKIGVVKTLNSKAVYVKDGK